MKNILLKKMVAVFLGVFLLLQGNAAIFAQAIDLNGIEMYTRVIDAQDKDGNLLPEYYLDSRGRVVDDPTQSEGVRAQAEYDVPAKYDGRTQGYLTPIKNQAGAGSCWAFSTVACTEANFIKKGYGTVQDTDFSEAHLAWFAQRSRYPSTDDPTYGDGRWVPNPYLQGGHWLLASATLMRGSGLQLEKNAPWTESYDADVLLSAMTQPDSDRYASYARLLGAHIIRGNGLAEQDLIKTKIMDYGAVTVGYYEDHSEENVGFSKTYSSYYQTNHTGSTNHMVTVVGWDDSFSREKFNGPSYPTMNGAWLIKGSYGTNHGKEGGYYWISYEEPTLNDYAYMEVAPADIYDNIYQYDGAYIGSLLSSSATSASMANTFVAERNEKVNYVSFYSDNESADVTVDIYVSDTKPGFSNNNPTAGMTHKTEATTTAKSVARGYSTIQLDQPVTLSEGQYFTVNVTFTITGGRVYVGLEGTGEGATEYQNTYGSGTQQSFFSIGSKWYAAENFQGSNLNNVPVKAMTVSCEEETLSIRTMPTKTTFLTGETFDLSGLSLLYKDSDGKEHIVTDGYTLGATSSNTPGTYTLTITYAGLTCTLDLTVECTPTLTVQTQPTKMTYLVGETFDFTGLVLSYMDKNGVTQTVTTGYTTDKTSSTTAGTCTVTVTYEEASCTVDFAVQYRPTLTVQTQPVKTEYKVGETPDLTGLVLVYTDTAGEAHTVTSGYEAQLVPFTQAGVAEIAVTYMDLTCIVSVMVEEDRTPGDANGDDMVNLMDVTYITRFLAGGYNIQIVEANSDVNGDGAVNLMDATLIRRYLAGGYGVALQ